MTRLRVASNPTRGWQAKKKTHLCVASGIRAMPEKEKPPAMRVDNYSIIGNSSEFPIIEKALPGGMRTPRRGKGCLKQPRGSIIVFPISRTGGGKIEPGEKKIPQPEPGCMQARYWLRYSERKQFKTGSCFTPVFYLFSRL